MPSAMFIKKKKQAGICTDCTDLAFPGYIQCAKHRKMSRLREIKYEKANWDKIILKSQKTKNQRKKNRCCTRCGLKLNEETDGSHIKCMNCREDISGGYYETLPKIYAP
jgi:hypothetical protein